jgi:hypothetical protein
LTQEAMTVPGTNPIHPAGGSVTHRRVVRRLVHFGFQRLLDISITWYLSPSGERHRSSTCDPVAQKTTSTIADPPPGEAVCLECDPHRETGVEIFAGALAGALRIGARRPVRTDGYTPIVRLMRRLLEVRQCQNDLRFVQFLPASTKTVAATFGPELARVSEQLAAEEAELSAQIVAAAPVLHRTAAVEWVLQEWWNSDRSPQLVHLAVGFNLNVAVCRWRTATIEGDDIDTRRRRWCAAVGHAVRRAGNGDVAAAVATVQPALAWLESRLATYLADTGKVMYRDSRETEVRPNDQSEHVYREQMPIDTLVTEAYAAKPGRGRRLIVAPKVVAEWLYELNEGLFQSVSLPDHPAAAEIAGGLWEHGGPFDDLSLLATATAALLGEPGARLNPVL